MSRLPAAAQPRQRVVVGRSWFARRASRAVLEFNVSRSSYDLSLTRALPNSLVPENWVSNNEAHFQFLRSIRRIAHWDVMPLHKAK
jgi:hypothetical protein